MKKIFQYSLLLLTAMLGFTACSDSDNYEPGTVSGQQVFFSNELTQLINVSKDANQFTIPLNRYVTDGALQVNLSNNDTTGIYNIPSSVSFEGGKAQTDIVVTYDPEKLVYDDFKTITITLPNDENTKTPYGLQSYTFTVGMPSPFESLGKGKYNDTFIMEEGPYTVEIMQNTQQTNVFRIMKPYDQAILNEKWETQGTQSPYIQITILKPGDKVNETTITEEGLVIFSDTNSGYYNTSNGYNQDIMLYHPSGFSKYQLESDWAHSRVLEWQENGLPGLIQLAPFYYMDGLGGWNYSANDGMVTILFPGYDPKDYEIDFAYTGRFTDTDDNDFGEGTVTLGADITSAKYVVTSEKDQLDAIASGLGNGTVEGEEINASGTVRFPLTESNTYYFVLVGFDGDKAVASDAFKFKFQASGETAETWTPVYIGTYQYTAKDYTSDKSGGIWEGNFEGTLYQSDSNPNTYLINPWADITEETPTQGLVFTMNEDNTLIVDQVFTGWVEPDYGEVWASDLVTGDIADLPSYYENGVFYFNLEYHVAAGAFTFVQDTFTLTAEAQAKMAAAIKGAKHARSQKANRQLQNHISKNVAPLKTAKLLDK